MSIPYDSHNADSWEKKLFNSVPFFVPIMQMPISPQEVGKQTPETASIYLKTTKTGQGLPPLRSFCGEGLHILEKQPGYADVNQRIFDASAAGDVKKMLAYLILFTASFLQIEPDEMFKFMVFGEAES